MIKKIIALTTVIVLTLAAMSFTAYGAAQKVLFERLDADAVDYVKVKATNNTGADATVCIIATYIDADDKIIAVNTSDIVSLTDGQSETITVLIEDKSDMATLRYYTWDKIVRRTPLENAAPVPSTEISSPSQTYSTVDLEWNVADDDYKGVVSYNVYNGGSFVGSTDTTTFTDVNRARGENNSYTVKSVDDEGLESKDAIEIDVFAQNIPNAICGGTDVKADDRYTESEDKFGFITDGDVMYIIDTNTSHAGNTIATQADGLDCRMTCIPKNYGGTRASRTYHPYKFSEDYAAEIAADRKFTFILTYFDDVTGNITATFLGDTGNQAAVLATMEGTNQWKTAIMSATINLDFSTLSTNDGNSRARIFINGPCEEFKMYSLAVLPTAKYNALLKEASGKFIGNVTETQEGTFLNGGINFTDKLDGITKTSKDNRCCASVPGGVELECGFSDIITGNGVTPVKGANVNIEVDYYTDGDEIVLTYNDGTEVSVPVTEKGKWQKAVFTLTDAAFNKSLGGVQLPGGADFTIKTADASDMYINAVRAYVPQ